MGRANDLRRLPEKAALLALMTFVKDASNNDLKARYGFTIEKSVRERLLQLGYISCYQGRHGMYVYTLTDSGWARCREELGSPAPARATKGYRLLYGVLRRLDSYLASSRLEIADLLVVGDGDRGVATVDQQIRDVYQELAGRPGGWVGLARLRAGLGGVPRREVDEALLRLDLVDGVYLIPESNQKVLTEADRAAAIRIGDEDKHLLSIES